LSWCYLGYSDETAIVVEIVVAIKVAIVDVVVADEQQTPVE
jgi:hypothetical protein